MDSDENMYLTGAFANNSGSDCKKHWATDNTTATAKQVKQLRKK